MSAASLVWRAAKAGVVLSVDGERLVLAAASHPDEHLLRELLAEKPSIVACLRGLALWSEEDWNALYDERAGIMEYDGGLSRAEAEARAFEEVNPLRGLVRSGDD